MKIGAAMLELVIHARERGEITEPRLLKACQTIEDRAEKVRARAKRRELARGAECVRCGERSRGMLMCLACQGSAPKHVREAFLRAAGLDEMRSATRLVLEYARGLIEGKEAA